MESQFALESKPSKDAQGDSNDRFHIASSVSQSFGNNDSYTLKWWDFEGVYVKNQYH